MPTLPDLRCPRGHALETPGPCPVCASQAAAPTAEFIPASDSLGLDDPVALPARPSGGGSPFADAPGMPHVEGYGLVREIGRGGMGVVYEAKQAALGRTVALKMILSGEHASPRDRERFRREAAAAASLQHPNIVQIFETGESDGRPFFAMELVPGGSLAARLDGNPWKPSAAARLIEILARAVAAAHDAGIVHRDLKPANVLLTRPELSRDSFLPDSASSAGPVLVKVTDFGLAKRVDPSGGSGDPPEHGGEATRTGAVLGTPAYLSPEQAAGRNREVGPPADTYALGAVLYELLTGRPPFAGETALETVLAVMRDEPTPPGRLRSRLPRDLETICLKCLQKEPGRRYATSWDLAEDLRRFLAGEPIAARPVGRWGRLRKWAKRHPAIASVGLVAFLGLLTMLGISLSFNVALREAARREHDAAAVSEGRRVEAETNLRIAQTLQGIAEASELDAEMARAEAEAAQTEQERGAYALLLSRVAALADRDPARALALLDQSRAGVAELRDFTLEHLRRSCQRLVGSARDSGAESHRLAFDPLGRWLAEAVAGPDVLLRDPATLEVRLKFGGHARSVVDLCFAPDGRQLATLDDAGAVRLWELPRPRQPAPETPAELNPGRPAKSIAFSGDGSRFAAGGRDGSVRVWGLGRPPAGGVLAGPLAGLRPAKLAAPVLEFTLVDQRQSVLALAFSPDGSQLLTGGTDRILRLWNLAGPTPASKPLAPPFAEPVTLIRWSPNGEFAAVVANAEAEDHAIRLFRMDGSARQSAKLRGHTRPVYALDFNAEGTSLVSAGADSAVRVWDLETRSEKIAFHAHEAAVLAATFDPSGRRIATGGHDKTLNLWDAEGRRAASFEVPRISVARAAVSESGTRLAVTDREGSVRLHAIDVGRPSTREWLGEVGRSAQAAPGPVLGLAFVGDGSLLVRLTDATLEAFRVDGPRLRPAKLPPMDASARAMAASPDGRSIAVATDKGVRVWDIVELKPAGPAFGDGQANALAYSPDGKFILAASGRFVQIYEAATGKPMTSTATVLRDRVLRMTAYAQPDSAGYRLAVADDEGQMIFFEVDDQHRVFEKARPVAHTEPALSLCVSRDGRTLASASRDRTLKLWDPLSGLERATLGGGAESVVFAGFLPNDKALVSVSRDGVVRFWLR